MKGSVCFDDYDIIITKDRNAEGSYYIAKISELETIGDGATREEAIESLKEATEVALSIAEQNNMAIPKPAKRKCSGKISLRVPKYVHEKLSDRAQVEGVSINQLIVSALSWFLGTKEPAKQEIVIHNYYNAAKKEHRILEKSSIDNERWRRTYA